MNDQLSSNRHRRRRRGGSNRRPFTAKRTIGGLAIAALVAACVLVITAVVSGEWQLQPILSGSMRPGLPVGGVVAVQRVPTSSLQVRDVVLFHPPGQPNDTYVHRIISMTKTPDGYVIRTQGDANRYPDPWTIRFRGPWAYEARFTVPLVGYAAVWYHSPAGRKALFLAGGSVIVLVAASVLVGELRRLRRKKSSPGDADGATQREAVTPVATAADDMPRDNSEQSCERLLRIEPAVDLETQADPPVTLARVPDRR